jgi:hypothetical protein
MILHLDRIDDSVPVENSAVGGNIYLQIGDAYFPEEDWYDYASLILEQWIPAIRSFANHCTDVCKLTFYDGPCYAVLRRNLDAAITVKCVHDEKTVIEERIIDFPIFLNSLVRAGNKFCRLIHLKGRKHEGIAASVQILKNDIGIVRETVPTENNRS